MSSFRFARCLLLLLPLPAVRSWGKLGHEMVANVAYNRLSADIKDAVNRILGPVDLNSTGSPLAAVADWADRVRYTHEYHWSEPLHFVDVEDGKIHGGCPAKAPSSSSGCSFVYLRDCQNDMCVAGAISNYSMHLYDLRDWIDRNDDSSINTNKWRLKESLMFVTHFVGDVHQPLHCARKSDKGGNTIHVHFVPDATTLFLRDTSHHHTSKELNLHSVWDVAMIEWALVHQSRESFERDLCTLIDDAKQTGDLAKWLSCADGRNETCTSEWAEESLEDAMSWAYRNVDGGEIVEGTVLPQAYYTSRLLVVQQRIATAGIRLAATLELALSNLTTCSVGEFMMGYLSTVMS